MERHVVSTGSRRATGLLTALACTAVAFAACTTPTTRVTPASAPTTPEATAVATRLPARPVHAKATPSDFNGDGYADLAVGAPLNGSAEGVVNVMPGSAGGLLGKSSSTWTQATSGIVGTRGKDRFGTAPASDDFNSDGFADLAVGAPTDVGKSPGTGSVNVIYGSSAGLTSAGNQYWQAGSTDGLPASGDRFGIALAAGDFDGDGYPDLAIGEPDPGVVLVLRGSAAAFPTRGRCSPRTSVPTRPTGRRWPPATSTATASAT